ncbi:carboxymuconolactone decarboxylase family protein [Pyruvatibacter sp.]|uniref:carboxymuconolactone decarboxylase family protein n=1 Tax=unclassified Pyruvatibacter TaxID=2618840 RepID=UPI003102D5CF
MADAASSVQGLKREDLPDLEGVFQLVEGAMGFLPNSMLIMARKPGLVEAFAGLGALIQGPSSLPDEIKRMVAFMASRAAGCVYCQTHTHHQAANAGIGAEKLDAIWAYETSDLFSEGERAALRVAQGAGQAPNAVTADDMAALKQHFTDEQIVDLVAVISMFGFLNRWNDTFATQLEADPTAHAKAHMAEHGWDAGKHAG